MKMRRGKIAMIVLAIIIIFSPALLFGYPYYLKAGTHIELLDTVPEEAVDFVTHCQNNPDIAYYFQGTLLTVPNDTGVSVYYFSDEKKQDIFYIWFATDYQPVNFSVTPWIDTAIEWEKGEPIDQPQLYRITIEEGNLHNKVIVRYRENGGVFYPSDYTLYLKYLDLG